MVCNTQVDIDVTFRLLQFDFGQSEYLRTVLHYQLQGIGGGGSVWYAPHKMIMVCPLLCQFDFWHSENYRTILHSWLQGCSGGSVQRTSLYWCALWCANLILVNVKNLELSIITGCMTVWGVVCKTQVNIGVPFGVPILCWSM